MDPITQDRLERLSAMIGRMDHRIPASMDDFENQIFSLTEDHIFNSLETTLRKILTTHEYDALIDCCPIAPEHFYISSVSDARIVFNIMEEHRRDAYKREQLVSFELSCQEDEKTRKLAPRILGFFDKRTKTRPPTMDFTMASAVLYSGAITEDLNAIGPVLDKIFSHYGLAFIWTQHRNLEQEIQRQTQEIANSLTMDFI